MFCRLFPLPAVLYWGRPPDPNGHNLPTPGKSDSTSGRRVAIADRIAREPAYHYLLRREFEEHGTKTERAVM